MPTFCHTGSKKQGIVFLTPNEMDKNNKNIFLTILIKVLFPVLTPLAVDESRPFPLLANKSLNIAVRLKGEDDESCFALVQVPSILSRF